MTDIVERLKKHVSGMGTRNVQDYTVFMSIEEIFEAATEIERLREKCNKQAMILQSLTPEMYPGVLFIHAQLGERDQNNMPEKLLVVPSYGVDWSQVYIRTEKTEGPKL